MSGPRDDDDDFICGDPRRCPTHGCVTSSPDGRFDGNCPECERAMDAAEEAYETALAAKRAREPRAKFWVFAHGWVRITLRPGETLRWSIGGPTEEGWHSQTIAWRHDGGVVTREWDTDGSDCDGRLSTHQEAECAIDALAAHHGENDPTLDCASYGTPEWVRCRGRGFQRDYSAEAAGY